MNIRTHAAWLAVTALGMFATQDVGLSTLELLNCQLDIQPKDLDAPANNSFILWGNEPEEDQAELFIVTAEEVLLFGDHRGNNTVELPEGKNKLLLTIEFIGTLPTVHYELFDEAGVAIVDGSGYVPVTGTYDTLLPLQMPVGEEVDSDVANKNRVRISVTNNGLTASFTLRDF